MAEHKKFPFVCLKCGSRQLRTRQAKKCLECRVGKIVPLLEEPIFGKIQKVVTRPDGSGFSVSVKLTDAGVEMMKELRPLSIGLDKKC